LPAASLARNASGTIVAITGIRAIRADASNAITPWVFQRSRYAVRSMECILS
jgi:hypothetical protein